jgi:hypothetical protein
MTRTLSLLAALLLTLTAVSAKDKHGKPKKHGNERVASERSIVTSYYRGLPPGLAKRNGDLPPGLQKQLRRNGALPPGLEKRFTPFPPQLEAQLPPCPPDVRRGLVGGVAIAYSSRTGLIVDAFAIAR